MAYDVLSDTWHIWEDLDGVIHTNDKQQGILEIKAYYLAVSYWRGFLKSRDGQEPSLDYIKKHANKTWESFIVAARDLEKAEKNHVQ